MAMLGILPCWHAVNVNLPAELFKSWNFALGVEARDPPRFRYSPQFDSSFSSLFQCDDIRAA